MWDVGCWGKAVTPIKIFLGCSMWGNAEGFFYQFYVTCLSAVPLPSPPPPPKFVGSLWAASTWWVMRVRTDVVCPRKSATRACSIFPLKKLTKLYGNTYWVRAFFLHIWPCYAYVPSDRWVKARRRLSPLVTCHTHRVRRWRRLRWEA